MHSTKMFSERINIVADTSLEKMCGSFLKVILLLYIILVSGFDIL